MLAVGIVVILMETVGLNIGSLAGGAKAGIAVGFKDEGEVSSQPLGSLCLLNSEHLTEAVDPRLCPGFELGI